MEIDETKIERADPKNTQLVDYKAGWAAVNMRFIIECGLFERTRDFYALFLLHSIKYSGWQKGAVGEYYFAIKRNGVGRDDTGLHTSLTIICPFLVQGNYYRSYELFHDLLTNPMTSLTITVRKDHDPEYDWIATLPYSMDQLKQDQREQLHDFVLRILANRGKIPHFAPDPAESPEWEELDA
jgi:hypothetical protein